MSELRFGGRVARGLWPQPRWWPVGHRLAGGLSGQQHKAESFVTRTTRSALSQGNGTPGKRYGETANQINVFVMNVL